MGHAASDKRIDILRHIGEVGSISEAARRCGVSYKAAWQAVETLANLAGAALVQKAVGGAGGGGASLTLDGQRLLRAAEAMHRARHAVLHSLSHDATRLRAPALAVRTSMRNQWPAVVHAVVKRGALVRVVLNLAVDVMPDNGAGVMQLEARITRESAELLALVPGLPVVALAKATAIRVARRLRARDGCNVLRGTVLRATGAAAGGEVSLRLANGLQLVGFAQAAHGLRLRDEAMAAVETSGVVIALAS